MRIRELKSKKRKEFINIRSKVSTFVNEAINLEVKKTIKRSFERKKEKGYVGIYWPLINEVDLLDLKLNLNIKVALPLCANSKEMYYCPWSEKPLGKDHQGIQAPINERYLKAEELDILFVPGISIDRNFVRLGYGGGYFDILRRDIKWRKIPAFVVIPEACVSKDDLPREDFDIPFDGWISELGQMKNISMRSG